MKFSPFDYRRDETFVFSGKPEKETEILSGVHTAICDSFPYIIIILFVFVSFITGSYCTIIYICFVIVLL